MKGALGLLCKGQTEITVVDYFDENLPELRIPLDPAKTPQGNMDDYFSKHKKFLTARKEIMPRIELIQRELREMEDELDAITQGKWQPPQPMLRVSIKGVKTRLPSPMSTVRPLRKTALPEVAMASTRAAKSSQVSGVRSLVEYVAAPGMAMTLDPVADGIGQ